MKKILIISILIISIVILTACNTQTVNPATPEAENLAKCLTENGAVFYGTNWCPHCNEQKKLFGSAMEYIVFVDCDANRDTCVNAGIEAYPTWIIGDKTLTGTQQLYKLSKISGCPLTATTNKTEA